MTTVYLVLSFFAGSASTPSIHSQVMPVPYQNMEDCELAGDEAKRRYTGGIHVDWTCVPA